MKTLPFLLFMFVMTGCLAKEATMVNRPQLNISPWQDKTVTSKKTGATYSYMFMEAQKPDAPSILLLHGGVFDNRIWLNTTTLSKRYNVFALNYPDNSLFYEGKIEDWGKLITDFTKALRLKPEAVAGVSNGAYGAIEYLLQNPDNEVQKLIVISAVMIGVSEKEIKTRKRFSNFALRLGPLRLKNIVEKRTLKTKYEESPGTIDQKDIFYVRSYHYYYQLFSVPKNQGPIAQNTMNINIPVLIIHGDKDDIMPVKEARLSTKVFKNCEFLELKDAGHEVIFSRGEQIAKKILNLGN